MKNTIKNHRALKITGAVLLAIILVIVAAFYAYTADYYRANDVAKSACVSTDDVEVTYDGDNVVFTPKEVKGGFIFYPGGKVEHTAYAPLMMEMAKNGYKCVLLRVAFNLAILDVNAADGVKEKYPEITSWSIGGHSLGGLCSAMYASTNGGFDNVLLLGAYTTSPVEGSNIIYVYGSLDGVMNRQKYDESLANASTPLHEKVIEGGNHAGFGEYGFQSGDGVATITPAEQVATTVEYFLSVCR